MWMLSYSHFFSKKFQHICVSLDVNYNESLTNDIVSFEQLGPGFNEILHRQGSSVVCMTVYAFPSSGFWKQLDFPIYRNGPNDPKDI